MRRCEDAMAVASSPRRLDKVPRPGVAICQRGAAMRTLVICDDYYHPARLPRSGLAPLEQAGFAFDWIEQPSEWSTERMAEYPVVILTKANNISAADKSPWATAEIAAGFQAYVRAGNGLL